MSTVTGVNLTRTARGRYSGGDGMEGRGVRSFCWTEIRPALVILKTDPYCAIRGPRCTVIATTVDHVVPGDDGRR
jgi:hypothetical protein